MESSSCLDAVTNAVWTCKGKTVNTVFVSLPASCLFSCCTCQQKSQHGECQCLTSRLLQCAAQAIRCEEHWLNETHDYLGRCVSNDVRIIIRKDAAVGAAETDFTSRWHLCTCTATRSHVPLENRVSTDLSPPLNDASVTISCAGCCSYREVDQKCCVLPPRPST